MDLIFFLVLFAALGYFLANSKFSDQVDRTTGKLTSSTRSWADRLEEAVQGITGRRSSKDSFSAWATGAGAAYFPPEFKTWLASLTDAEAQAFSRSLADYANGQGLNLTLLVQGSLDRQPALRQVFVEAVVVYSQAFRKAKQARQEAEAAQAAPGEAEAGEAAPNSNGNKTPGKRADRQNANIPVEASNGVSAA
jgi:hypothetical protein